MGSINEAYDIQMCEISDFEVVKLSVWYLRICKKKSSTLCFRQA